MAGSTEDVLVTIFEPLEPINVWVLLSVNGETIAEESSVVSDAATYSLEVGRRLNSRVYIVFFFHVS